MCISEATLQDPEQHWSRVSTGLGLTQSGQGAVRRTSFSSWLSAPSQDSTEITFLSFSLLGVLMGHDFEYASQHLQEFGKELPWWSSV